MEQAYVNEEVWMYEQKRRMQEYGYLMVCPECVDGKYENGVQCGYCDGVGAISQSHWMFEKLAAKAANRV